MNELVYLSEEDYENISIALMEYEEGFCGLDVGDAFCKASARKTRRKLAYALNNGLFLSFETKKVKVRRVRR